MTTLQSVVMPMDNRTINGIETKFYCLLNLVNLDKISLITKKRSRNGIEGKLSCCLYLLGSGHVSWTSHISTGRIPAGYVPTHCGLNSAPNTWETAWVMWRWTDLFHHYYFTIKTNGIEFGKKDTSCSCEQQVFLKTGSTPTLSLGTWDHIKISSIGKHTTIWVDGIKVVDMDDPSYSSTADMSGGYIGPYNEDASSAFDKVTVTPQ